MEAGKLKNIYFIEARSPGSHIFSWSPLPRLGSITLGTILKQKGFNVKVIIEDIAQPAWSTYDDADMICISSVTSTAKRAFQIAEKFKERAIPIVIGGPHSTFLPEESLEYADYVVRGEGEITFSELIDNLQENKPLSSIKGLSYKENGKITHNANRELIQDLDSIPIPDFSLVYKWGKSKIFPIATSRGCPYACKFCSVIPMFGRKYRFKSVNRIIEEIEAVLPQNMHYLIVDDNFAANIKRTKALLQTIIDRNIKIEWSAQARTDIAKDPELFTLMKKAGCYALYIGLESFNPNSLSFFDKKQGLEDIENTIRLAKINDIKIHGMFVLGSDMDDIQTIRDTGRYAKKLKIESIQFMVLTPYPGTPIFEEFKTQGRIIHMDWSKYDCHHAVIKPKLMTPFELQIETMKAMAKFYSWSSIAKNLLKLDLFYAFVGLYGNRTSRKALSTTKSYLEDLWVMHTSEFDKKTDSLRKYLSHRDGHKTNVILNIGSLEETESRFFAVFLKKINNNLIVNRESLKITKNALSITPLTESIQTKYEYHKQQLANNYETYKQTFDPLTIINLESVSLFNTCFNIGLLLNVKTNKIRKAYEQALKSIGGNSFECNKLLIMLK